LEDDPAMTNLTEKEDCGPTVKKFSFRSNWLFEVEPYSRVSGESLSDLRDNRRIKKALKRAINKEFAPRSLVDAIQNSVRR
jgi:hypothetical protein